MSSTISNNRSAIVTSNANRLAKTINNIFLHRKRQFFILSYFKDAIFSNMRDYSKSFSNCVNCMYHIIDDFQIETKFSSWQHNFEYVDIRRLPFTHSILKTTRNWCTWKADETCKECLQQIAVSNRRATGITHDYKTMNNIIQKQIK